MCLAFLMGVGEIKWDGLCKRHLTHFKVNRWGHDDKDEGDAMSSIYCLLIHSQP